MQRFCREAPPSERHASYTDSSYRSLSEATFANSQCATCSSRTHGKLPAQGLNEAPEACSGWSLELTVGWRGCRLLVLSSKRAKSAGAVHFSSSFRIKYAFATSYADQQMAVLGAAVTTLAFMPRKKPFEPSLLQIIPAALKSPFARRISMSVDEPLVCNSVFTTSKGVVAAAAKPPAKPPAVQCVSGSYPGLLLRCMAFVIDSYAVNCNAVKGTVIVNVVGYEM